MLKGPNYFENIILPNGKIVDADPSHLTALIKVYYHLSKNDFFIEDYQERFLTECPIASDPISFLVETTGCIAAWYNSCKVPTDVTAAQKSKIQFLFCHKLINYNAKDLTHMTQ